MAMQVTRNENTRKFEISEEGSLATLDYSLEGPDLSLDHTFVPKELRGKGLAQELAKAALSYARDNNLKVLPYCTFVQKYVAGHPEYQELISSSFKQA